MIVGFVFVTSINKNRRHKRYLFALSQIENEKQIVLITLFNNKQSSIFCLEISLMRLRFFLKKIAIEYTYDLKKIFIFYVFSKIACIYSRAKMACSKDSAVVLLSQSQLVTQLYNNITSIEDQIELSDRTNVDSIASHPWNSFYDQITSTEDHGNSPTSKRYHLGRGIATTFANRIIK